MSTSPEAPAWLADCPGDRVLILGADGFIGSRVVHLALAAGARVTAVCLKPPWRLEGLHHRRLELVPPSSRAWWTEDDSHELGAHLARADALALLAYTPPPAGADEAGREAHEHDVNATGARRVGEIASAAGATVVFASSADVYGPWHDTPVTEDTKPDPVTPYARAKHAAEQMIAEACAGRSPAVALRISTAYGPGETGPRAIPSFVRSLRAGKPARIEGDGLDLRDYVHVDDVATAVVNACLLPSPEVDGGAVNVSSGTGRTTLEVLTTVAAALGVHPERRHVSSARPPSRLVVDPARSRALLRARPRPGWEEEVNREVTWLLRWLEAHEPVDGTRPLVF